MLAFEIKDVVNGRIITKDAEIEPWVGVDLDGTLAEYHGFEGVGVIGAPIPKMVNSVKEMIRRGYKVKIFTARVADPATRKEALNAIQDWLVQVGLPRLDITCVKDTGMERLYDDRVRQVEQNTGRFVDALFTEEELRKRAKETKEDWTREFNHDIEYSCGHKGKIKLTGSKELRLGRLAAEEKRICPECYKKCYDKGVFRLPDGSGFFTGTVDAESNTTFQGMKIHIENDKGDIRKGVNEEGEKWKTKMYYPYGEILGTEGVDGDPIDCFIGPDEKAEYVFIIRLKADDKEDKCMLGFADQLHARDAFCAHYAQPADFLGPITKMKVEDFKAALKTHKKGTRIE